VRRWEQKGRDFKEDLTNQLQRQIPRDVDDIDGLLPVCEEASRATS
jgi:hypothetical protein